MAGLSAGDVLVAIDGLRVTGTNLDTLLGRYAVGAKVAVHAFRRDKLMTFVAVLQGDRVPGVSLTLLPAPKKAADRSVLALHDVHAVRQKPAVTGRFFISSSNFSNATHPLNWRLAIIFTVNELIFL